MLAATMTSMALTSAYMRTCMLALAAVVTVDKPCPSCYVSLLRALVLCMVGMLCLQAMPCHP